MSISASLARAIIKTPRYVLRSFFLSLHRIRPAITRRPSHVKAIASG